MSPANSLSSMVDKESIFTLTREIDNFVVKLGGEKDLVIHDQIDQFFYMEKAAELRVLAGRIEELQLRLKTLESGAATCYKLAIEKLAIDKSWLTRYIAER